jgi:hypothetical protein
MPRQASSGFRLSTGAGGIARPNCSRLCETFMIANDLFFELLVAWSRNGFVCLSGIGPTRIPAFDSNCSPSKEDSEFWTEV